MDDVGVDLKRFETVYDRDFFKRHNLGAVTYFNKETFGEDKVVRHAYCNYPNYVEGVLGPKISNEEAARQAPLSERGQQQLLKVLNGGFIFLMSLKMSSKNIYTATLTLSTCRTRSVLMIR